MFQSSFQIVHEILHLIIPNMHVSFLNKFNIDNLEKLENGLSFHSKIVVFQNLLVWARVN